MKILILTQYYPPEHGAPQNRLHHLAARLKWHGCEVSVLTALPNYPSGIVFPGYEGKFFLSERIDGIDVLRSWILPAKTKGVARQLLSYFSFVFSSIYIGVLKSPKADFIVCESPPIFLGLSALLISIFKGAKLIMNISDLWPESAVQLGIIKRGFTFKMLEMFELFLYRRSTFVSCQTEGIRDGIKSRLPSLKTILFPNGVDLVSFRPSAKIPDFRKACKIPENFFLVGYAGNHGRSQALRQIIDAAEILKDQNIFFAFFGDGPEKNELLEYAKSRKLANLAFYPSRDRTEMFSLLCQFDMALVPLKNISLFDGARPSKMFELMACEIPFIFCGRGEGAEIAVKSGAAVALPPEEAGLLADAILKFANSHTSERKESGKKARKFVADFFDREKIAADLYIELKNSM